MARLSTPHTFPFYPIPKPQMLDMRMEKETETHNPRLSLSSPAYHTCAIQNAVLSPDGVLHPSLF